MKCPLCGCEKGHIIYKLCDNMKIMGASFPETPAYVAGCNDCGLVYTDTEATQQDFLLYYANGAVAPKYYEMFDKGETDEYYEHLLEVIKPYITDSSCILDVAGSWGEFDKFLYNKGYRFITNVDVNEKCIGYAKENGVNSVLADSTNMNRVEDRSIDFVILNHTLEHILDVESTISEINRVLKDSGHLFIEIPDAEGYVNEDGAPFNFLTYEHVLHMTMNDLENLAAIFGYEILLKGDYYKKVSNYPSIFAVLKKGCANTINYSNLTEKSVKAYIRKSESTFEEFLRPLKESQEPLILWGVGASTAILLSLFDGCNVVQLIDKNPIRQGITFNICGEEHRIVSPDATSEGTIVILSIPYRESIKKQIREMGLNNKIVVLG